MKAAFAAGSSVEVREVEAPRPGPGDVLVRMASCGICGSDVEKVYGSYGQPSTRLGHEPAGVVEEAGPGAAGGLERGDRVFTHHHVPCYSCHYCRNGSETMCPRYYSSNLSPCGLAERYLVPAWNVERGGVLRLPDGMGFGEAAMIEPLACCVRAWNKAARRAVGSVAVYGAGPAGVMHAMLARRRGAERAFCLDVNGFRLRFAEKAAGWDGLEAVRADDPGRLDRMAAGTGGRGVDLAVVATSNMRALDDAMRAVRKGGTVLVFGVPPRGHEMRFRVAEAYSREVTLESSYAASDADTAAALGMVAGGEVDVGCLITHRYRLDDSAEAFERARSGEGAMKVVVGSGE